MILLIPKPKSALDCILHECGGDPADYQVETNNQISILHECGGDPEFKMESSS